MKIIALQLRSGFLAAEGRERLVQKLMGLKVRF